eukprot:Em0004g162a
MLVVGFSIWKEKNVILAKDSSMFVSPHYDGVLLEQQILLNRKVEDVKKKPKKKEKTVFVCSTMYREDSDEMEQMLSSIHNLACYYSEEKDKNQDPETCDHFESHVFFDGGVNGDSLTHFALQLVSLLEKSLSVDIKCLETYSTEVSNSKATEFLTKDMGEDRWLCTLLVEKGWRLEYCAVSENHTHCPRRLRYVLQATQELIKCLTQPVIALIVLLLLLSIAYGLFCIYGKPLQHQLDVAKFASLYPCDFHGGGFAGNLKNMIYDCCHPIRIAAIQLPDPWSVVFPCAAPGYLLLLIYSVANLDDRSWGTREASSAGGQGGGVGSFKKYLDLGLNKIVGRWTNKTPDVKENRPPDQSTGPTTQNGIALKVANNQVVDDAVRSQCGMPTGVCGFVERHGYFKLSFIAGMTAEDLKFIGIQRRGYILRLEKAAKDLPPYCIISELNCDDFEAIWYYRTWTEAAFGKGSKNTACLCDTEGHSSHLQRLVEGIDRLTYATEEALKALRNATLAVLLLINIMWIVLLYTLQFPELVKYNLPSKAFEALFSRFTLS